jgi:hypothetical protein
MYNRTDFQRAFSTKLLVVQKYGNSAQLSLSGGINFPH